ncbi:homoaconitase [bacterium]|jgi:homoaconitate hydratase|nr:homoaconitase [bacterium]
MAQTIIEKIAQSHAINLPESAELHAGDFVTLVPDHVMTHDNTAAVMNKFESLGVANVHNPDQPVYALDHDIQNKSETNVKKYARIEKFAADQGIAFHPAGSGIGHQMMLENGFVKPGGFCVASDSHSNIYGAVGAVGTPVVRTDAAALWATGKFWWQIPPMLKVVLTGEFRHGVTGKDLILTLCSQYSNGEALNCAIEFSGPGVANLSMDARMTISNMTTEWGALVGWFPCDDVTIEYYNTRLFANSNERLTAEMIQSWKENPLTSDADANYAAVIELDLGQVTPHIAGPHVVQLGTPLATVQAEEKQIHKAYLLSCVNSRLEDLEIAASVINGRKIKDGVDLYLAAASQWVEDKAKESGAWQKLLDAGATALPPSCGPCIGLGIGLLEAGEVGISATNRNFKGRMGDSDSECYLASPPVVVESAINGYISGPESFDSSIPDYNFTKNEIVKSAGSVEIIDGFPSLTEGRMLWLDHDNLNTDGIYSKDYTYREDITVQEMARVVMENYDSNFAEIANAGDLIIGGFNFGTGSSREQAVTALQAAEISMVIAGSYSQTYLRNAINNGFICLESPQLVEAVRMEFKDNNDKTAVGENMTVDFANATITWNGKSFGFAALGRPVQEVIVAGGIENMVRNGA